MIVPDINILIHAYNSDSPRHAAARGWWEQTLRGPRPVGVGCASVLGLIRIMTHQGILGNSMTVREAIRRARAWLNHPRVQVLTSGECHSEILFRFPPTPTSHGSRA